MARSLRVEYEGATYHVLCRGNRGVRVFDTDEDVALWLQTLGEACERSGLVVHAWCVMKTHYHLLLETPNGNLVEGMKWLQGTFTQRYNARHKQWGHLFQGRYKAKIVDEDPAYFRTAGVYILLNPVDAGIINLQEEDLDAYPWSSFRAQIGAPSKRPEWLETTRLMSACGIGKDSVAGRRAFAAYLTERGLSLQLKQMSKDEQKEWKLMERGWVHGSKVFRDEMIALLEETGQASHAPVGQQKRDIDEQAALLALKQGLELLKLRREDLGTLRKGDSRKLLLAGWLRTHFEVSATWCADVLELGHYTTAARGVRFYREPPREWKKSRHKLDRILGK